MTEQVRAMSHERAGRQLGRISDDALTTISRYLHLFIV
jgi:mRNA-degrading endonuclease toxin of MazEF toxin-antitoxin module